VSQRSGWSSRLSVAAAGQGLVGHAGAVLLRRCADKTGLTSTLNGLWPRGRGPAWWDRGLVLVDLAITIALGGTCLSDITLLGHQRPVFGAEPSDSTVHRVLAGIDETLLRRIAKARAVVRARVWDLLALRPGGFPWLSVAGKVLTGWVVIDLDATLIGASSDKDGAAPTYKKGYGFHPLGAWCANTMECLAMLLRPGNAGSNTVTDHITVLTNALAQIPAARRRKILIRIDGAGATHDLIAHLHALNTTRRTVRFTVGWTITDTDEQAIAALSEAVWEPGIDPDGAVDPDSSVAELTGVNSRGGWVPGMRLIVRRVKPSRRHAKKLTAFERATGWRYQITATTIDRLHGMAGSQHPQWIDILHRGHAVVEDRVRTAKATGLRNLPSQSWDINRGWVLAANIAADLDAWTRLLGLHDQPDLARAEPETLRYRLWHLPAKLTHHARRRTLTISPTWPWTDAFLTCWHHLGALPDPT
jgi:hypothetical protein